MGNGCEDKLDPVLTIVVIVVIISFLLGIGGNSEQSIDEIIVLPG